MKGEPVTAADRNMDRVHARLSAALLRMVPPDVAEPFFKAPPGRISRPPSKP